MNITQELAKILADVDRPGDYFVAGQTEFLAPRIEVDGVGLIALPLLPAQAKQLIKAPRFGRPNADTVQVKPGYVSVSLCYPCTRRIEEFSVRITAHWGRK